MGNQVSRTEVIGYVGQDPEIRYTAGGDAVANLSVCYTEKWKKDGVEQEKSEWFRCSAFGSTADKFIAPYVHKGDLVRVVGQMWTRKWQDKDGNDRYSTELKLDRFEGIMILKSKDDSGRTAAPTTQGQAAAQGGGGQGGQGGPESFDQDIPFDSYMKGCEYLA